MTAQQPPHAPVRLLIAESSENAAHRFDSLLRDAGIATRPQIIDLPMALDALGSADMMLCNASLPQLQQLLPRLIARAPHVPIIIVNNETTSLTATEVLGMGAADVVADSEPKHLVLVVKRELEHVCQNLRLLQTRRALEEAEARCRLLLQGSKAAIAYVHEGMHIYANEVYLNLFGFDDADDLLGLPLIDLLDAESAEALKRVLKKIRQDEAETEFEFAGTSTDGAEVRGSMTLAGAEYEGEHCLQVTVRSSLDELEAPVSRAEGQRSDNGGVLPAGSVPAGDDDIPTLTDSPVAVSAAASDSSAAPAAAETEADDSANEESFKLELEESDPVVERTPEPESVTNQVADIADRSPDVPAGSIPIPAAVNGSRTRTTTNLSEFLNAAEASMGDADDVGFCSVFVAQVDGYPELQQEYGLSGAEKVCAAVQETLSSSSDAPNMPLSSYQWAVALSGTDRDSVLDVVDGYRQNIEELLLEVKQKTVRPTVTFGGARLNMEGCDSLTTAIETALDNAFSTMQDVTGNGDRNCIELPNNASAEEAKGDEANRVLTLVNEAIESQKFVLLFQPIISLRGDSDEHYEVFLRLLDRNGEQMVPNEFLRTAIENGVAGKIDRWVILQSIKMLSSHRSKGNNTRLTINVTSNSVADPEFIQWLGVAIKAARLPSDAVIFQITERDASNYIRQTREFVEGLKKLHCRSSLSRFGLTEEPFEILRHIPSDFVKLDGSWIESLANNPEMKEEVTEMIQKLQEGGKLTIVPMVESANVLSALWQAGANYIQGHYLQQPSTSMDYDFSTDD